MAKSSKSGEPKPTRAPRRRAQKPTPAVNQPVERPVAEEESSALSAMENPGSLARFSSPIEVVPPASLEPSRPERSTVAAGAVSLAPSRRSSGMPTSPGVEEIRRRAFELFMERGGQHGHDKEDWLKAERELRAGR